MSTSPGSRCSCLAGASCAACGRAVGSGLPSAMRTASFGENGLVSIAIGVYWIEVAPPCAGATVMKTLSPCVPFRKFMMVSLSGSALAEIRARCGCRAIGGEQRARRFRRLRDQFAHDERRRQLAREQFLRARHARQAAGINHVRERLRRLRLGSLLRPHGAAGCERHHANECDYPPGSRHRQVLQMHDIQDGPVAVDRAAKPHAPKPAHL